MNRQPVPPSHSNIEIPFPDRPDFAEIKRRVSIEDVLRVRGLLGRLRRRGGRLSGPCPIHGGDNPTAFVVNCSAGLWFCFTGCHHGGDAIELVRRLDGVSHREAAARMAAITPGAIPVPAPTRTGTFRPFERALYLDPSVPWLSAKGILPSTASTYEAGAWNGQGMLAGCVAVRLHSPAGAPWGYTGRRLVVGDPRGKWVFPSAFPKGDVLFGYHRLDPASRRLAVVECPWGVMRLAQIGVPAVALLGTSISDRQAELLSTRSQITLLFDGDDAGRRGAREAVRRLEMTADVVTASLPSGADPDDLSDAALLEILH